MPALLAYATFPFDVPPVGQEAHLIQPVQTILIDGAPVRVAVADTPSERQQGLSGITELQEGQGMLFVFEADGQHSFWMKDMLFSIDMLWIAMDETVVHIAPSVSPETFPQAFTPSLPARYVLEVPAGFSKEHGIGEGSQLTF